MNICVAVAGYVGLVTGAVLADLGRAERVVSLIEKTLAPRHSRRIAIGERLRTVMRRAVVLDGRNVWEAERMRRLGFESYSIGRKPVLRS